MHRIIGSLLLALPLLPIADAAAHDACAPPTDGRWSEWLDAQEALGGHTMACHLGIKPNGLIGRIENRGGHQGDACLPADAASTWSDKQTLLAQLKGEINALSQLDTHAAGTYQLQGTGSRPVGLVVLPYTGKPGKNNEACHGNDDYQCRKTRNWQGFVRRDQQGRCFLLTAYPVP